MKTFVLQSLVAVALGLMATLPAAAQELKIGYINADRVVRESTQARAAQTKLEAEFSRRERELSEQAQRLKSAADRLEREMPTLSASERQRRERELVDEDRDFQRKRREFLEDRQQRIFEEQNNVLERANRVIKQIFEAEKYDLIIQEGGLVVFAGPRVDITDKVIRALNAPGAGGTTGAAPSTPPR